MELGVEGIAAVTDEDRLRAHCYGLLACLLVEPPSAATLDMLRALDGDDTEFGHALGGLAAVARSSTPASIKSEFDNLFVGLTRGELLPYASYYQTGFLHEKPLAQLRGDFATLGISRADGVSEPEDHIGCLCEMMTALILGTFGPALDLQSQRRFFDRHLGNWAPRFFADLETAKAAAFYAAVGRVGTLFMAIEAQAFEMTH